MDNIGDIPKASSVDGVSMHDLASPGAEWFRLALIAVDQRNGDAAYQYLTACLKADPTHAGAWFFMSDLLYHSRKYEAALCAARRCNQYHHGDARALTNLGWFSHVMGDNDTALYALKKATQLAPELYLGWTNLSQVEVAEGMDDIGLIHAQRGVDLAAGEPVAHMALAFAHMKVGDIYMGLREYETRIRYKLPMLANYPYPRWQGEPTGRLFIQAEQGLGDSISMLRFIPLAATRAQALLLYVNKELVEICQDSLPSNVETYPIPQNLPDADAWAPMLSLPLALGITENAHFERFQPPYLTPYPSGSKTYAFPRNKLKKIAICWAGSKENELDRWRSIPLTEFLPLTGIEGATLYSLQVGDRAPELASLGLHGIIEDMTPYITSMRDNAQIMADMDLVITVDTANAHLAAALGIPAIVVTNRRARDWRWGRKDLWYPKTTLIERGFHESWAHTMKRVVDKASQMLDL